MSSRHAIQLVLSIVFAFSANSFAKDPDPKASECPQLLTFPKSMVDPDHALDRETHSLLSLLYQDPTKNLAVLHPSIVMGAYQRTKSWLYYMKPRYIPNPIYYAGHVKMYPVLSQGIPEASRRRIIGQYSAIENFGRYVELGADGDDAASQVFMVDGPPGTAKTEFLMILLELSKHLQTKSPDHFNYTYEWHGLAEIPELRALINLIEYTDPDSKESKSFEHPFTCPLGHSPLVLLPPDVQDAVIQNATARVKQLVDVEPTPHRECCTQCAHLKRAVLNHYADKAGKHELDNDEAVKMLAKHIRVKRRVIGRDGKVPKINAEGKDVDYAGLLMAPNAFVINVFGQDHPFSYWLNGKIAGADGGLAFFDEYFRNDPALRDALLELFENKVISRGGGPLLKLDLVAIAATNTESVKAAEAASQSNAQLDRTDRSPMRWSISPYEIGKTILQMRGVKKIRQQKLADHNDPASEGGEEKAAEITAADLDELFPLPQGRDDAYEGHDHRYRLFVKSEGQLIHVSPHTLMFMSMVVAASRMNTNVAEAAEIGGYKIINSAVFRNVIARLKILTKKLVITPSEATELFELSGYLKEGQTGISTRNVARNWFSALISEARKPGNGNCITPKMASDVFRTLLKDGAVRYPDNKTRLEWLKTMDAISHNFLVPSLMEDVNAAVGSDSNSSEFIYDQIYNELLALTTDPSADSYQNDEGEVETIDRKRLAEIEELFKEMEGRPLARGQIIQYHSRSAGSAAPIRRHEGLLRVIRAYLAKLSTKLVPFNQIMQVAESGEGKSDSQAKYSQVHHHLTAHQGYCPKCIKAALQLMREKQHSTGQQEQE